MGYVATQPIQHNGRTYNEGDPLDFEPSAQLLASSAVAAESVPEVKDDDKPKRGRK